jgi:hypothetical protein
MGELSGGGFPVFVSPSLLYEAYSKLCFLQSVDIWTAQDAKG